jgi:ATP-dependent Clp protease ATP-binding subunit ClpA
MTSMTNLEVYQKKFTSSGWRVFEHAVEESRRRQQNYVSLGHILVALWAEDTGAFRSEVQRLRVGYTAEGESVASEVGAEKLLAFSPRHQGLGIRIGPDTIQFLRRAMAIARSEGRQKIEPADMVSTVLRIAPILYCGPQRPSYG